MNRDFGGWVAVGPRISPRPPQPSACSDAIVLPLATVSAAKENVYIVGTASKPSQYLRRAETEGR